MAVVEDLQKPDKPTIVNLRCSLSYLSLVGIPSIRPPQLFVNAARGIYDAGEITHTEEHLLLIHAVSIYQ